MIDGILEEYGEELGTVYITIYTTMKKYGWKEEYQKNYLKYGIFGISYHYFVSEYDGINDAHRGVRLYLFDGIWYTNHKRTFGQ